MRTSSWKTIKDDNTIGTDWKDLRIVNLVISQSYDDNVPVVDSDVNFVDGDWWRPVVTKFLCRIRHRNIASLTLFLCFPPKTYFGGEARDMRGSDGAITVLVWCLMLGFSLPKKQHITTQYCLLHTLQHIIITFAVCLCHYHCRTNAICIGVEQRYWLLLILPTWLDLLGRVANYFTRWERDLKYRPEFSLLVS